MKTHDDPEDDAILSAYLDGELDFELRQVVESSLATDPAFADRLRRIREVRDLLSTLPRPHTADLSPEILKRIERNRRLARRWTGFFAESRVGSPAPHLWGGLTLIAASLVIGLLPILAHFRSIPTDNAKNAGSFARILDSKQRPDRPHPQELADRTAVSSAPAGGETRSNALTSRDVTNPQAPSRASEASRSVDVLKHELQLAAVDPQDRVRRLLDSPSLRHVFIVTDTIGGSVGERVTSLVEQSAKTDYYVITVAQGIVIDPRHPSEAKVYAFTLSESELDRFRTKARSVLGVPQDEIQASAEVVTQLADIGQVLAFTPPAAGEIVIPRSDVALKTKAQGRPIVSESLRSIEGVVQRSQAFDDPTTQPPAPTSSVAEGGGISGEKPLLAATPESPRSVVIRPGIGQAEATHSAKGRDDDRRVPSSGGAESSRPVVVLVWVASPRPG